MPFKDIMSKVRHIDNIFARWMLKHFYILFFELVLVITFFFFFFSTLKVIDISHEISPNNITTLLIFQQTANTLVIIFLLLLNSFWMLFIFSGINRLRLVLKEINYNLIRQKNYNRPPVRKHPN